jgi:hypothetical protein
MVGNLSLNSVLSHYLHGKCIPHFNNVLNYTLFIYVTVKSTVVCLSPVSSKTAHCKEIVNKKSVPFGDTTSAKLLVLLLYAWVQVKVNVLSTFCPP